MCSCRPGSHRSSFKYPPGTFYKGDEDLTDPEERKKLGFVQPEANAGDCKRPWAHLPYALDGKKRLRPACTLLASQPLSSCVLLGALPFTEGLGHLLGVAAGIIMPLRLNHAVMTWLPTDRNRVVLFYTFIPQFYYSELPPTSINSAVMHEHAHHLDPVRARPLAAPFLCATCQAFAQLAQHQRANLLVALFNRLTGGLVGR